MASRGRPRGFNKQEALARAMKVFWAKGFEGASMNDLTLAMGIGSPSLYAAFGSKEALFREAVALYTDTDGASIWAAVSQADTPYGVVEGFLMTSAREFTRSDRPRGCLVVLSALHASEESANVREDLATRRRQAICDIARQLSRGVPTGEIAPTADLEAIASFYVAVQQGMSIQARDGASRATLEKIAEAALSAWGPLTSAKN